jgi:glycosyltransferase involved in cell wall biosynthesis
MAQGVKLKRVCIVRHNYYPEEAHVRRDAETLVKHGYDVDVVCLKKRSEKSRESVRGVNIYRLPVEHHRQGMLRYIFEYSAFLFMAFWVLGWLSLRKRYKVVEVVSMPEVLVFTTLFPKLLGAKVVLYMFDHSPETFSGMFGYSPAHPIIRIMHLISKVCLGLADHAIACTFGSLELTKSRTSSISKITLVLNVPDESVFINPSLPSKSPNTFCLITHGSILEKYGIQTMIKAVPLLTNDIAELKVLIVGEGEYRPCLEELARSLNVSDRVHFTGLVPFEEVSSYIAQADIGIVPTILPMFPNKLFEYLAMGKPVVAANSLLKEAVKAHFDNGALMVYETDNERDLARCVLELYRNPEKRATLAASGSAAYQKFRWDTMKYEYLKVFDKLAE